MQKVVFSLLILSTILLAKQGLIANFEVINPKDKSIYNESIASINIKVPKKEKATNLIIKLNEKSYELKLNSNREVYCKSVDLKLGKNKIEVVLYRNQEILKTYKSTILYQQEIFPETIALNKGYEKNYFHTNKNEKLCKSCHDMNDEIKLQNKALENVKDVLEDTRESKCFDCHKKLNSRKNSHAPSVNLICTECHNGNVGEYNSELKGKSRFIQPDPISNRCFNCHENVENEWLKREYTHGPAMNGRCSRCHNPHGSDEIFFTKKPIWDLCTTCHSEKAVGNHVVTSFVFGRNKGSHPTKAEKDPAREGRSLVCSSCHNPHGSNGIHLLRMEGKKPFGICARCHDKL